MTCLKFSPRSAQRAQRIKMDVFPKEYLRALCALCGENFLGVNAY
jgi:hypothetical protein